MALTPDLVAFLDKLADHNDRDWFKANQKEYEAVVREPVRQLIRDMAPVLVDHAPALTADDRKVGGSMMRPQRDTRFSADKTPYKTHVGVQFRHRAGKDVHAPGLYLHIAPDEVFVGLGLYRPASKDLKAIRQRIADEPASFTEIVEDPALHADWTFGDVDNTLKTAPRGFDKDHPMIAWLNMKSHILVHTPDDTAWVYRDDLPAELGRLLESGRRYAGFLCGAMGQDW